MIKTMKSKMTTNSQLSATAPTKNKQTTQTTRRGTESQMWRSQKWRSHGRLTVGKGRGENGGKGTRNKKRK